MNKTKVYIVEDEAIIARDIASTLQELGYEVSGIDISGEDAINNIPKHMPNLVLMDIMLKGKMDGIEAADYITSKYNLPIIYLTAFADDEILQRAKITGPFGYLIKPFDKKELHLSIEMALYKHKVDEELRLHSEHLAKAVAERTEALNLEMAERKKAEEELLKAQKLESVGILAGGIAHDFNNILTTILTNLSLAKLHMRPSDNVFERLTAAERATLRAQDLTQQLLTFSRGGSPVKKTASIDEILHESIDFALRGSNVKCELVMDADLWPVEIDEGQISQVISNLVINADQAMPLGGTIIISANNKILSNDEMPPLPAGKYVLISIEDTGTGIPKKYLDRIFDPYFTTKQGGSGLGLATSYSVIKKHEGHIFVKSMLGSGTTFYILLPASENLATAKKETSGECYFGRGKVLVMDDDPYIRESLGEALTFFGYEAKFAEDGERTIEAYKNSIECGTPYDVVIMDLTIPGGMGGAETIKRLRRLDPKLKAVVSSGYSNDPIMSDYKKFGFSGVIGKPYRVEDLSRLLHDLLAVQTA